MSEMDNANGSTPIFVVGYLHSGTSLLRRILGRSPSVFTGHGETRFFDYLPMIRRRFPDLNDDFVLRDFVVYLAKIAQTNYGKVHFETHTETEDDLEEFGLTDGQINVILAEARLIRDYGKLFRVVFDNLTRMSNKRRWLEKTPTHLFHIDHIVLSIPEAQFVELVRDPRDILASKRARRSPDWSLRVKPERRAAASLHGGFDPLWDTLGWRSAIRYGDRAKKKYPQSICRLRYEDLVAEPEMEVSRICDFLGLPFSLEMLNVPWSNTTLRSKWNSRGIGTAAIGKWRSQLRPEAIAMCQWLAGAEMKKLRYSPTPIAFTTWAMMPLLLSKSGFEFFERLHRRWRLGGFRFLRNVLRNYWRRLLGMARS